MSDQKFRNTVGLLKYSPLILGVLCLFCALVYAVYVWALLPEPGQNTIYWFHQSIFKVPESSVLALVPWGMIFTGGQFYILRHQRRRFLVTAILGLIFVTAWMLSCIASLTTIFGSYTFHDELVTANHVYRLDSQWKGGVGGASSAVYWLWECDEAGWICHIVCSERIPPIYSEEDYQLTEATLRLNQNSGNIEVVLGDETICSYPD